jgi:SAM-dependent methyltransferase
MPASILSFLRCPRCAGTALEERSKKVSCKTCASDYPVRQEILDMMPDESAEVITPFQRLMQAAPVARIYERLWRPLGYYIGSSRPFSEEVRTVLRLQQETDCSRILDLACGTGVFARPLARAAGLVIGFDLSWPMLDRAKWLAHQEGTANLAFIRGTVFKLPFIAEAFPSINCCGALHLFDQPDAALREMRRVLRPGGHVSIQTTIQPDRSGGMAYFLERFIRFGFFKEDELKERMRRHGFEILRSERHRISFTQLARKIG